MTFLDDVKEYLRTVQDPDAGTRPGTSTRVRGPIIDPAWVQSIVVDLLERLEKRSPGPPSDLTGWRGAHYGWVSCGRAVPFARQMAQALARGFMWSASDQEIREAVANAIARRMGVGQSLSTQVRTLELDRVAESVWDGLLSLEIRDDCWGEIDSYAREIRAVRSGPAGWSITPIARVLLEVTGRDAVAWILHVELAQSTGPGDPWRLSRETAAALHARPRDVRTFDPEDWAEFPHSWSTLRRMEALDVLAIVRDHSTDAWGYELREFGKTVLTEVLSARETPFSVLAHSLSEDELLASVSRSGVDSTTGMSEAVAATATSRQARMFAHEIRNALTPAEIAVRSLIEALDPTEQPLIDRYRPRIEEGIGRVFRFVDRLLRIADLAARPPEEFTVAPAIRDALVHAGVSLPVHEELSAAEETITLRGYRERFVLAVANVLRNSEQSGSTQVWIRLTLDAASGAVELAMEDDGPGVPEEHRGDVFRNGFSLRAGGTGYGLALAREVVEKDLRGRVFCGRGDQGGARIVFWMPLIEGSPT